MNKIEISKINKVVFYGLTEYNYLNSNKEANKW